MHVAPTLQLQALLTAYLHDEALLASIAMERSSLSTILSACGPCQAVCSVQPSPPGLQHSGSKREYLSFRQGPSKRFFETAEGLEQVEQPRCIPSHPSLTLKVTGMCTEPSTFTKGRFYAGLPLPVLGISLWQSVS